MMSRGLVELERRFSNECVGAGAADGAISGEFVAAHVNGSTYKVQ